MKKKTHTHKPTNNETTTPRLDIPIPFFHPPSIFPYYSSLTLLSPSFSTYPNIITTTTTTASSDYVTSASPLLPTSALPDFCLALTKCRPPLSNVLGPTNPSQPTQFDHLTLTSRSHLHPITRVTLLIDTTTLLLTGSATPSSRVKVKEKSP